MGNIPEQYSGMCNSTHARPHHTYKRPQYLVGTERWMNIRQALNVSSSTLLSFWWSCAIVRKYSRRFLKLNHLTQLGRWESECVWICRYQHYNTERWLMRCQHRSRRQTQFARSETRDIPPPPLHLRRFTTGDPNVKFIPTDLLVHFNLHNAIFKTFLKVTYNSLALTS
jgi:hypothetical protein